MSTRPHSPAGPAADAPPDGEVEARARRSWHEATALFFREFRHSLFDEATYDVRGNPTLWIGFLMALPIPVVTWAAAPPVWLLILSIPAPLFWGMVLGAAGRVGIRAEVEAQHLKQEIDETRSVAQAERVSFEGALDEEVARRQDLERRDENLRSELKLAEGVHRTLLPDNIQRRDAQVAIRQIPSQVVGGDYLYAAVAANRWLYLCVGDVSGHGIAAALVVARLHGLMRRLTLALRSKPVTVLEHVNRAVLEIFRHTYFFLTLAVFRLDLHTGVLQYATAGHPAQILLRKDGKVVPLRTPNRLLGIDPDIFDARRPSDRVQLETGDSLVFFTDGLFEILSDEDGEMLGEAGLHDRIASLAGLAPALFTGEILQELADFQGHSTFADDVSLMVATYKGTPGDNGHELGHLS